MAFRPAAPVATWSASKLRLRQTVEDSVSDGRVILYDQNAHGSIVGVGVAHWAQANDL